MRDRLYTLTLVFITLVFSTYAKSYIFKTQYLFFYFYNAKSPWKLSENASLWQWAIGTGSLPLKGAWCDLSRQKVSRYHPYYRAYPKAKCQVTVLIKRVTYQVSALSLASSELKTVFHLQLGLLVELTHSHPSIYAPASTSWSDRTIP